MVIIMLCTRASLYATRLATISSTTIKASSYSTKIITFIGLDIITDIIAMPANLFSPNYYC